MRYLIIPFLLSLTLSVIACDGEAAKRFINMDIPGTHDLGQLGTYVITNTNGTLSVTKGTDTATDLVWAANPNILLGRFGDDGFAIRLTGKGKVKWSFFPDKYKSSQPASGDDLSSPSVSATSESSEAKPVVKVKTVQNKPKDNHGHGNNEDGVDKSNPGKTPKEDSDPKVDDEK